MGGSRTSSAGLSFMLHVEDLLVLVQALVSVKDITWIALKSFTRFRRPSMFKGVLQDSKVSSVVLRPMMPTYPNPELTRFWQHFLT